MVKTEDSILLAPFTDCFSYNNSSTSMLDMFYNDDHEDEQQQKSSPFGFMELLGFQNTSTTSIHHTSSVPLLSVAPQTSDQDHQVIIVPNHHPTTPNSNSSYSSASSTAALHDDIQKKHNTPVDDHEQEDQEDDDQQKLKIIKELKPKQTTNQKKKKKEREPRIAFMTRSEVDHLEDGYRWRKYGQKAVKNSPFPRGYYRCTNAKCNVKKRVERCFNDPSAVVTTYEGKHTHPSPASAYPNSVAIPTDYPGFFHAAATLQQPSQHSLLQAPPHVAGFNCGYLDGSTARAAYEIERHSQTPTYGFLTDHGLLQDIVPSLPGNAE